MRVTPTVFAAPEQIGQALAALIADRLAARRPGTPFLLGCPSGRSAHSTYRALADEVRRRDARPERPGHRDDGRVRRGATAVRGRSSSLAHSCARFGREEIVGAAQRGGRARPRHRRRTTSGCPTRPTRALRRADRRLGGIDLFILASGASDGHIAFNPPGTARRRPHPRGRARRADPPGQPRDLPDLRRRPRRRPRLRRHRRGRHHPGAVKRVVMVAHGAHKAAAVAPARGRRALRTGLARHRSSPSAPTPSCSSTSPRSTTPSATTTRPRPPRRTRS